MHVTLVHVQVKPGRVDDFIAATKANHEGSLAEPGNRRFDVLRDPSDPAKFVLYEAYVSAGEAAKHKETAHYLAWREAVEDMMAAPRKGIPYSGLFPKV
jgi:autoinducer 2-degrading protein